ncbi:hypothetical protein [Arthrobacter oryzae]|uniref:Uncharacterized protein n=1 Tax=Arthrobacter oryzae TaxID=409290 RepID=A0A3N0CA16_9MICC|nr:hypothetical protein [Arthrobacter oryzae]RNL59803.1 hypothetical protein D7003_02215 [Arthrobacter oryzae]
MTIELAGAGPESLTADAASACLSRSGEVQELASRVAACAENVDAALAQLARLELQTWQSPAGRAYRTALSFQAASLRSSRNALQDAAAVVLRHARHVVLSSGRPGY